MGRRRLAREIDTIQAIFSRNMVEAIFTWGFRYAHRRKRLDTVRPPVVNGDTIHQGYETWAAGLDILRKLSNKGLPIIADYVRNSFILRMWILFGPGYSQKALNREARRRNKIPLAHYIKHTNSVWPGLVYWVDPRLLDPTSEESHRLLVQFFGRLRSTNVRKLEHADVAAWAEALKKNGSIQVAEPYRVELKERAWERSRFRIEGESLPMPVIEAAKRLPPAHQSLAARSSSSHPPPSLPDTPEPP
jgi:hypothetical protein